MVADGGYIRDYILRGDLHSEVVRDCRVHETDMPVAQRAILTLACQDLDVALPLGARQAPQDGLKTIRRWSASNGLLHTRQNPRGPLILEVFFSTPSGAMFPVQVRQPVLKVLLPERFLPAE